MASWGFPLVSSSGRIYVLWDQYQGIDDVIHQHTGTMAGSYSDDGGQSWSPAQHIPMPRSPRPLLRRDHGDPIPEPLCCCPIYELETGRYVLLHHNNVFLLSKRITADWLADLTLPEAARNH